MGKKFNNQQLIVKIHTSSKQSSSPPQLSNPSNFISPKPQYNHSSIPNSFSSSPDFSDHSQSQKHPLNFTSRSFYPSEEKLKQISATFHPKDTFQITQKWFDSSDVFNFDHLENPFYSQMLELGYQQIKMGERKGKYNFPKQTSLGINVQLATKFSWESYVKIVEGIAKEAEISGPFDYMDSSDGSRYFDRRPFNLKDAVRQLFINYPPLLLFGPPPPVFPPSHDFNYPN